MLVGKRLLDPECQPSVLGKTGTGHYHHTMNINQCMEWFEQQCLPHIPTHSVIVHDDAKYHNAVAMRIPTTNTRKAYIQECLHRYEVQFDGKTCKKECAG